MPVAIPQLYQYEHVPETRENLDWADCEYMNYDITSNVDPLVSTYSRLVGIWNSGG